MGDAKNAMATTVNLILYYMIPPELAERWLQPATPHKQWCQCGFCPRITRKEKVYTSNRDWSTLHREVCYFKHHNATNDATAFLSFKFTFLLDSQNPQDGGMIVLRNNGNHVQNYIISKPRSP
jgi:hypothetical protein